MSSRCPSSCLWAGVVSVILVLGSIPVSGQEIAGAEQGPITVPAEKDPTELWEDGFVFRTGVGACFQQALSGRNGSGLIYERFIF
jgi:hypothetical protein